MSCSFCNENDCEFTCETCITGICYPCRSRCDKCMETICPDCDTEGGLCNNCLEDSDCLSSGSEIECSSSENDEDDAALEK